jgi:hypothetical protein
LSGEAGSEAFGGMTMEKHVMHGLDPCIYRLKEDGRIKSGHDVVGK